METTNMMISKASAPNSARVSGTFKVMSPKHAGTKHWLYVWDQNRGDSGSWRPVMPLELTAVLHWEDMIKIVTGEIA
jgi:hypothetical protein